jgi:hypothetical protein
VADALSRPSPSPPVLATVPVGNLNTATATGPPPACAPPTIDYAAMAAAQLACTDCSKMCDSRSLFITSRKVEGTELFGDISTGTFRPLVPPAFRESATAALHGVAHPGVEATVRLVTSKFCWPGIRKFVRRFAQQCLSFQRSKVSRHIHLAPETIAVPRRRFEHVHVDLVGPLPHSAGFSYLFTIVDRTTRWKRYHSAASPPPTAQLRCSLAGYNGSAFPLSSRPTEWHNSPPVCGPHSAKSWLCHT